MKFKKKIFLSVLSFFPLLGCSNLEPITPYLKDASYQYSDGKITINFISEGIKSFDLYQKEAQESEYTYIKTIKEKPSRNPASMTWRTQKRLPCNSLFVFYSRLFKQPFLIPFVEHLTPPALSKRNTPVCGGRKKIP